MKWLNKKTLIFLVSSGFSFALVACDLDGKKTLTELLFNGVPGSIFTCKVTAVKAVPVAQNMAKGAGRYEAEVDQVYFGNVDTKAVTLATLGDLKLDTGKTYLVYSADEGHFFYCGGAGDKRTRWLEDVPDSVEETRLIAQFSAIERQHQSGYFEFKNEWGKVIAQGNYKDGKAVGTWKHFFQDGNLKSVYDFDHGAVSEFTCGGGVLSKIYKKGHVLVSEKYSSAQKGILLLKEERDEGVENAKRRVFTYNTDGSIKRITTYKINNNFVESVKEF